MLENRQNMDDDRMSQLEVSLKDAQMSATEADKKYEEVRQTFTCSRMLQLYWKVRPNHRFFVSAAKMQECC